MRIISGTARGTALFTLEGDLTRPTLDRVKEALFSKIQNKLVDSQVLDLFAGSGALGLESLSRGANSCYFCDNSGKAINIIKKNIEKTKFQENAKIIYKDYDKALEEMKIDKFDIIFVDPPYAKDIAVKAIEQIIKLEILKEDGIIILETDDEKRELKNLENIDVNVNDFKKYGRVKLIFLSRKG